MNPMTNTKNIKKLSEQELKSNFKTSWHDQYRDSAWLFVGGLPYDLTEGDIICIFSQYGEVVNINLIRDKLTGKQKGFCFLCYEDQRSTILAVDNLNAIKILGRTIRVDHVADYKVPKEHKDMDADTKKIHNEGCAPTVSGHDKKAQLPPERPKDDDLLPGGLRLPERLPIGNIKQEIKQEPASPRKAKVKKEKKSKKSKKKSKKKRRKSSSNESNDSSDSSAADSDSEEDRKKKKRKSEDKRYKNDDKKHRMY